MNKEGAMQPTQAALDTLAVLRDGSLYQWYVIPLFALVVYVYAVEIERKNWSLVFAGLAYWGMDWFNEIWNGLFFHFTNHAPVWGVAKSSAYIILIGLNIEICFMFAIAGIAFCKMLPKDRTEKVLGIPNRLFFAIFGSAFCVFVEVLLNRADALIWEWPWWSAKAPWLIFLLGYFPFFLVSFRVYDMPTRQQQIRTLALIYAVDIVCLVVFMGILKWI